MVVWSQASVMSHWVQDEATRGRDRGILIPVRIDDMELPLGFGMFQTARLTQWLGDVENPAFIRIVQEVTRLIGPPAQSEPETPAPETPPAEARTAAVPVDEPQVDEPRADPQPVERETRGRGGGGSRGVWLAAAIGVIVVGLYVLEPFQKPGEKIAEQPAETAQQPPQPESQPLQSLPTAKPRLTPCCPAGPKSRTLASAH